MYRDIGKNFRLFLIHQPIDVHSNHIQKDFCLSMTFVTTILHFKNGQLVKKFIFIGGSMLTQYLLKAEESIILG